MISGDGPYGTRSVHEASISREAELVVPARRSEVIGFLNGIPG